MNEEERFLHDYLCQSNLYIDIPSYMEYLNIMFEKLENPSDKETIDNILEITISNYYHSKIRFYREDAVNDSFDEEYEKGMEEKRKNRIPLNEESPKRNCWVTKISPIYDRIMRTSWK